VFSGGTSSATTINGGGTEYVYSGGNDFGTIINSSVGSAGRLIKTRSHRIGRVTRAVWARFHSAGQCAVALW